MFQVGAVGGQGRSGVVRRVGKAGTHVCAHGTDGKARTFPPHAEVQAEPCCVHIAYAQQSKEEYLPSKKGRSWALPWGPTHVMLHHHIPHPALALSMWTLSICWDAADAD